MLSALISIYWTELGIIFWKIKEFTLCKVHRRWWQKSFFRRSLKHLWFFLNLSPFHHATSIFLSQSVLKNDCTKIFFNFYHLIFASVELMPPTLTWLIQNFSVEINSMLKSLATRQVYFSIDNIFFTKQAIYKLGPLWLIEDLKLIFAEDVQSVMSNLSKL